MSLGGMRDLLIIVLFTLKLSCKIFFKLVCKSYLRIAKNYVIFIGNLISLHFYCIINLIETYTFIAIIFTLTY
jgi:hypothetical protein